MPMTGTSEKLLGGVLILGGLFLIYVGYKKVV